MIGDQARPETMMQRQAQQQTRATGSGRGCSGRVCKAGHPAAESESEEHGGVQQWQACRAR